MTVNMPAFRPRKVDEAVNRNAGFIMKPIQAVNRLSHGVRHALHNGDAMRCGHCGEIVQKRDWNAHKRYCWFGGGGHPTWFKGMYPSGKLRITDRPWAEGERNVRR